MKEYYWKKDSKEWFKVLEYLDFIITWDCVKVIETLEYYATDTYTKLEFKEFRDKINQIYNDIS